MSSASTVAMPAVETASSALLPSEAAPGPATWAGLLLRSLRRLGVEPLQLLRRGGRGGRQGSLGTVVNGPSAPVHAQELYRRIPEERWQLLQRLVNPGGDVSNGSREEMAVLTSGQSAVPRL